MIRKARVDLNQKDIVFILRSHGAVVLHTHTLKNLFDIIVCYKGKTFLVEIKDGNKPLTEGEIKCKQLVESVDVKYWVVRNVQDAIDMLEN